MENQEIDIKKEKEELIQKINSFFDLLEKTLKKEED